MALYEDFLSRVLIEAPGCAEVSALLAIKDACIEFCEKSLILVRDHEPVSLRAGVIDYDLEPPTGTLVIKVMRAWVENAPIDPMFPDIVRDASVYNQAFSSYKSAPSIPRVYLQKEERTVSVWPVPDKDYPNGLTMRVALKPSRASTTVDDVLYEEYAETIAAGALGRLLMSSGKPYTNTQAAMAHKGLFTQGLNVARQRAGHGLTRSNLSVRMRRI